MLETKKDTENIWKAVLAEMQVNLSELNYNMWIKNTLAESIEENVINILCPNTYVKSKLQSQFSSLIQSSVNKIAKGNFILNFKVSHQGIETTETGKKAEGPLFMQSNFLEPISQTGNEKYVNGSGLLEKYTFEKYIMGSNNRLAFSIAQAVAESPGKTYNPFFLYSGVGLGKTHLIHAIGNRVLQLYPNKKVMYCTGENFTNELIETIQSGKGRGKYNTSKFREKYRNIDLLIIDDIQFIAGKESTQEEFFHTFNTLLMSQKQIVIASDRPPKDFKNIEERITSRFGSGIIADIQKPDFETRVAILRNKRDINKHEMSNEVIDYIAQAIDSNIRELEGAYLQVMTYANATGEDLSVKSAANALGQAQKEEKTKPVNMNQILKAVCHFYSATMSDIKGKKRTKELVIPRQTAMYLIYELTETPYMSIGDFLGGRDHTTVLHGVKKVENELKTNMRVKNEIEQIRNLIYTQ